MSMTAVTVFGALATFLGTLVGAGVSLLSTGAATRAEWRRQEWQFEAEQLATPAKRRGNFESLVRSAAIELSEAWAQVVRSHDGYRQIGTGAEDADAHRSRMVEALTGFGLQLNTLLILPISDALREQVLAVDAVLDDFRRSINQSDGGIRQRGAVRAALLELFRILRETDFLRPIVRPAKNWGSGNRSPPR